MMNQLNEIDSSKEIDAIENHLLAQINQMQIPCKTNQMLQQLKQKLSTLDKELNKESSLEKKILILHKMNILLRELL